MFIQEKNPQKEGIMTFSKINTLVQTILLVLNHIFHQANVN